MARASIPTYLPLDSWAKIMGINPWEFNQIGLGFPVTNQAQCPYVWFQNPWQYDYLCREELAEAISQAEEMLVEELHYFPVPVWTENEPHDYPRPRMQYLFGQGGNSRNMWKTVTLDKGKVITSGRRILSVVGNAPVIVNDADSDGVVDTFMAAVATTVTDASEIVAYFNFVDRNLQPVDVPWQIRPVKVTISGGMATITGHASLIVLPVLCTEYDAAVLDVTDLTIYATSLDIYRVQTDNTATVAVPNQGLAYWEPSGRDCSSIDCSDLTLPICIGNRDFPNGIVSVDYTVSDQCLPRETEPDKVTVNYLSGVPLVGGTVDPVMAKVIAYLATGLLPEGNCACGRSSRIVKYWQELPSDKDGLRSLTQKEIDECPFPQSRGALWAWHRVRNLKQLESVST